MKTFMANPAKIERKWYVVDATGYTLGRLASEVAKVLRGKNKPVFTPHVDTGDYIVIVKVYDGRSYRQYTSHFALSVAVCYCHFVSIAYCIHTATPLSFKREIKIPVSVTVIVNEFSL